jgi:2-amino-4-hydroxy-6-hydroxymethyldihydropteridine diphosphokinase
MTAPASMRSCVFSLGANLGDRLATLENVCDYLADVFGGLRLSQVYETEPVGCPEGSPSYLNACVEVETDMPAEKILTLCMRIEQELGRVRSGVYGEPRVCDIDLICCGNETVCTPELTLPHPRAHEREFVLRPLCDLDARRILPGQTRTVAQLLEALPAGPAVTAYPL